MIPVRDWRERLVCSRCGSRDSRYGGEPDEAAVRPIIARRIVIGGLMLWLSACSTKPIDIICPRPASVRTPSQGTVGAIELAPGMRPSASA